MKGRKPKLAVVPETQVEEEVTVIEEVEEEEDEQVEFVAKPRHGSIVPASVTKKPSFEVCPPGRQRINVSVRSRTIASRSYRLRQKRILHYTRNVPKNDLKVYSSFVKC